MSVEVEEVRVVEVVGIAQQPVGEVGVEVLAGEEEGGGGEIGGEGAERIGVELEGEGV